MSEKTWQEIAKEVTEESNQEKFGRLVEQLLDTLENGCQKMRRRQAREPMDCT